MTVSIEEHFGGAVRSAAIASDFRLVLGTGRVKHLNITLRLYEPNDAHTIRTHGIPAWLHDLVHSWITINFTKTVVGNVKRCSPQKVYSKLCLHKW